MAATKSRAGCLFSMMTQRAKFVVWLVSALLFGFAARAVVPFPPGNPYQEIVRANVFGLKAPEPPAKPPPPPLPKIRLTGITTFPNGKRALLEIYPVGSRDPQAKGESYTLSEGQRVGEIEILEIDLHNRLVKIDCEGTVTSITFEAESAREVKTPAAPPPEPRIKITHWNNLRKTPPTLSTPRRAVEKAGTGSPTT